MIRVPGEQAWAKMLQGTETGVQLGKGQLPKKVHSKYPLPGNEGKYLGALVKVRLG
jgi:hypothetical protein